MLHRSLPDLNPPPEGDLDTPDMVETTAILALGEQHRRMLTRIAEIGMELLELNAQNAKIDPAAGAACGDAFCKISQAVRRTIALQEKLARDAKTDREGLAAERTRRRADAAATYKGAKQVEIALGLDDAYAASCSDERYAESGELLDRFLVDGDELLDDADEFRGYLDRPVGETVARLCAVIGLDPDSCVLEGDTWKVRRPPSKLELTCEELRNKGAPIFPSPSGEGQTAKPSGWGSVVEARTAVEPATLPHPGRCASGPSP